VDLLVSDDGEGIAEEDLKKIFTPFYTTLRKDMNGDRYGVGLDLWLAWNQLDRMGGRIVVDGSLGQVTTFTISLTQS
jgi:C4-dicarboxylate-specific signal transduction histidine kinase